MKYIEAPEVYKGDEKSLFLAGGIKNCPNWQKELVDLLKNKKIVLFNPLRKKFPSNLKNMEKATEEQIIWENEYLRKADAISFWFPKETICPIALYELGSWSVTNKPIFIGVHPEYPRKQDIEIQTKLVRQNIKIVYDLKSLSNQIKKWIETNINI